jgi:hypothetical protein
VFLGIAAHAIPYTSLTLGSVFLDQRASTIAQEQPKLFTAFAVALTVQANVPDLIRHIVSQPSGSDDVTAE